MSGPDPLRCVRCGAWYRPDLVWLPLRAGPYGPECINSRGCGHRRAIVAKLERPIAGYRGPKLSSSRV